MQSVVFLDHSPPYILKLDLSRALQLSDSVSLAVRLALETPCLHFADAGITGGLPHIQLFPGL